MDEQPKNRTNKPALGADQPPTNAADAQPQDEGFPVEVSCVPPLLAAKIPRVIAGAVICGAIGTELIYKPLIGTLPIPFVWLLGPAAVGVVLFLLLPSPRWTRGALFNRDRFVFVDSKRRETAIEPAEVMFISGVKGLNFDGGELMAPKSVRVLSTSGTFGLKVGPAAAPEVYSIIAGVCDHAVQLPFDGGVHVPESIDPGERDAWLDDVRHLVTSELGKVIRNSWIGALVSMVIAGAFGTLATFAIMSSNGPGGATSRGMAKASIGAVLALVSAFLLAGWAIKVLSRRKRILASIK